MPPTPPPLPAFIADAPLEGKPYGRWDERLVEEFALACEPLADEAGAPLDRDAIRWFPERGWGGRVYLPLTARAKGPEGPIEYFGHVSFVRPDEGEPEDVKANADFTDVTADDNRDWRIDLNDDVIGRWRTDGDRGGEVTLVWGLPLDHVAVVEGRFSLVAVDALRGFGEDLYLDVKLWDRHLREIASESLYEEAEPEEEEGGEPEGNSEV